MIHFNINSVAYSTCIYTIFVREHPWTPQKTGHRYERDIPFCPISHVL